MSRLAIITFVDGGPVDPGFGQPGYGGGHPGNALPTPPMPGWGGGWGGGNYPSQGLPGGGHISLLPVFPFDPTRPDNSLPGSGGSIDNSLPTPPSGTLPIHPGIVPGAKFVVKWLACSGLILVPDNTLPATPEPK